MNSLSAQQPGRFDLVAACLPQTNQHSPYLVARLHPTLGEGLNGKLCGSGPDPFPPPHNKRERVGYARLNL